MLALREALQPGCSLLPYDIDEGRCARCGASLPRTLRRWCTGSCHAEYQRNHYWQYARLAALVRDGHRCVRCGFMPESWDQLANGQYVLFPRRSLNAADNWLEVNHIKPRMGRGYNSGCHHHLDNLEVLCHRCHVRVTRKQRRMWMRLAG